MEEAYKRLTVVTAGKHLSKTDGTSSQSDKLHQVVNTNAEIPKAAQIFFLQVMNLAFQYSAHHKLLVWIRWTYLEKKKCHSHKWGGPDGKKELRGESRAPKQ